MSRSIHDEFRARRVLPQFLGILIALGVLCPSVARAEASNEEEADAAVGAERSSTSQVRIEVGSGLALPIPCRASESVRAGVGPSLSLGLLAAPASWFDLGLLTRWVRTSCGLDSGEDVDLTFRTVGMDARASLPTEVVQPIFLLDIGWMFAGSRRTPGVYICFPGGHQPYIGAGLGALHRASPMLGVGLVARYVFGAGDAHCSPSPEVSELPSVGAKPRFGELRLTVEHALF